MSHLVGIDKGPVMDWTNDSGLDEWYRKWKKQVEVLFKGPLNVVLEAIKCNYVVYWSGDHRMDLVGKWTTEGKINDGNKDRLDTYWTCFKEYIHPQTNRLIAVVELKCYVKKPFSLLQRFVLCLGCSFFLCSQLILYANNTELMFLCIYDYNLLLKLQC